MNDQYIIDIGAKAVLMCMMIAAPALLSIMVTGLIVSIFQAATQINEQTLSFIPKIIAMTVALFFAGPWILQTITSFTTEIFHKLPQVTN